MRVQVCAACACPQRSMHDACAQSQHHGAWLLSLQGAKAPAPLVHFDDDIMDPRWFKETIDGVQPVMGSDDFDPEDVNLECELGSDTPISCPR